MNANISNALGASGAVYITDTNAHTGNFRAITALEATVIATLVAGNWEGTLTSVPLPAGCTIGGAFTSIDLASGKVVAYE